MANFRGARHLLAALSSVLRQSHADLELIVSDDASPDDSRAIVRATMARDKRVRLIETAQNAGPAAARNRAIDMASGEWIAVVDSDDLMHPQRLERLLAAAGRLGVDMIADDPVFFGPTPEACGTTLLLPLGLHAPMSVSPGLFLQASGEDRDLPALGYLKPMIRRSMLGGLRYDEDLRIGEDFDLVLRLLLSGLRYAVVPDPMYLYRRHDASISHRLSEAAVQAMTAAHDRVAQRAAAEFMPLLEKRRRGLVKLGRYEELVTAIRTRQLLRAAGEVMRHPPLVLDLGRSLAERLSRKARVEHRKKVATIRLGQGALPEGADGLAVPCPAVPAPGEAWAEPPARMAAALSRLWAHYELSSIALDDAGAWAAALVAALTEETGP